MLDQIPEIVKKGVNIYGIFLQFSDADIIR